MEESFTTTLRKRRSIYTQQGREGIEDWIFTPRPQWPQRQIFDTNLGGLCGLVVKILAFLSVSSVSLADVAKGGDGAKPASW